METAPQPKTEFPKEKPYSLENEDSYEVLPNLDEIDITQLNVLKEDILKKIQKYEHWTDRISDKIAEKIRRGK